MAAIRHPKAKTTKRRTAAPKGAVDEVASLRAQLDAAVNDYQETIRLTKLYMAAIERHPPKLKKGERSAWDKIIEAGHSIPQEELDRHPRDGARNLHHYLYGTPKQDPD